jgi:hypothetical protein
VVFNFILLDMLPKHESTDFDHEYCSDFSCHQRALSDSDGEPVRDLPGARN